MKYTEQITMKKEVSKHVNQYDRILPRNAERLLICKIEVIDGQRGKCIQVIAQDRASGDVWIFDEDGHSRVPKAVSDLNPDVKGEQMDISAISRKKVEKLIKCLTQTMQEASEENWTTEALMARSEIITGHRHNEQGLMAV